MTKRWSSTRSDLRKTKRQASKEMRVGKFIANYEPMTYEELNQIDEDYEKLFANSREK